MQEGAYDEYGEGEYDEETGEPRGPKRGARSLSEVFEPEVMRRKLLTVGDKEIKLKDIPERIQVCLCLLKFPVSAKNSRSGLVEPSRVQRIVWSACLPYPNAKKSSVCAQQHMPPYAHIAAQHRAHELRARSSAIQESPITCNPGLSLPNSTGSLTLIHAHVHLSRQLCHIGRGEADEDEVREEALWIYDNYFDKRNDRTRDAYSQRMPESATTQIENVIKYMRNEHLEVCALMALCGVCVWVREWACV